MEEPNRIGLTAVASAQLDELLMELNPKKGEEGVSLIKFDLYRLAVAIGIKNSTVAPQLPDKSLSSFRVSELDEGGMLFAAVEGVGLVPAGESVYEYIERLAEYGINEFYRSYTSIGQLPLEAYFKEDV